MEALFGKALEIARQQEAKLFELRSPRAGLPVVTEGLDTRDPIEAKTLLEDLG